METKRKRYTNMNCSFKIDDSLKQKVLAFCEKKDWKLSKTVKNAFLYAIEKGFLK